MEDVFISYAREDRARAEEVASAFRTEGCSVFFDPQLQVGRYWDENLEEKADAAKAVVTLWSKTSVKKPAVRSEAWHGLNRQKLMPAQISECELPMFFANVETADLRNWKPEHLHHYEWRRLVAGVVRLGAGGTVISSVTRATSGGTTPSTQLLLPLATALPPPINGNAYDELKHSSLGLANSDAVDLVSYKYSAGRGEPWAEYMLGIMHVFGIGVALDYPLALQWLRSAAVKGWSGAHYALGVMFECGIGVKANTKGAIASYRRAARRGHEIATRSLMRLETRDASAA